MLDAILTNGYLAGQFLVAMPIMADPRFERSVIYICAHAAEGSMGIVINQPMDNLEFPDILEQLGIQSTLACEKITVHCGGPVESARGFVLHSSDYDMDGTMSVNDDVSLSATTEVLKAMAYGTGPERSLMALGYAGWGAGQLDGEIKQNTWLTVPADTDLLFAYDARDKWDKALGKIGITSASLSGQAGSA